jgi:hypothetical protein
MLYQVYRMKTWNAAVWEPYDSSFFLSAVIRSRNLKCDGYCMYNPTYLHMICIICLVIFTTNTHIHTCFLHKAHLANLVLQDCAVNGKNKVKLLMCFHVFAFVFGGRQDDCRWNVLTTQCMISGFCCKGAENCALLGYNAGSSGNSTGFLLDSWSLRMELLGCLEMVRNYHLLLHNNPEERSLL